MMTYRFYITDRDEHLKCSGDMSLHSGVAPKFMMSYVKGSVRYLYQLHPELVHTERLNKGVK